MQNKLLWLFLFALGLHACSKDEAPVIISEFTPPDSSYGLIYTNIFQPSCALSGCHVTGNRPPNLLGTDVYANIIDGAVVNNQAAAAGLLLVQPFSPDSSFLYQKMIFADSEFKFGAPMPLGGVTVEANKIEFLRQWIAAGAPQAGHVADRSLME